ncbi:MAG: nucleotide sugar dehydrogenase [Selenomonadaceae bacterium]|nr:nucleotide sugar dehydrogenase [Selenomonadaceae bacterium]
MRVGIVGLGYVGLTLGIAAATVGVEIFGTEINPAVKAALKNNHAHFHETGLNELIAVHNNKNFHCVEEFPADKKFDAFIITVGTPLRPNSKTPNFDAIESAVRSIANVYDGSQVVILRSTVSVGTTRKIILPLLAELSGKSFDEVFVGMCPERTVEGKALEELRSLPQIVSGNNSTAIEKCRQLFKKITSEILVANSLEEAELAKLYCNTYRDMIFAIGNAFCLAAQSFGVDGVDVINLANYGYSRAGILKPGFVAGPCLEKDAYLLTNNMNESDSKNFILTARKISESLEDIVIDWVSRHVEKSANKPVVLSGMAFKGRPETSDLRGSSSVNIAKKLKRGGGVL